VVRVDNDSATTYLNPWSWNNEANLLFIDQPDQVGYSYDVLTNVTLNILSEDEGGELVPTDFSQGVPETNNTFFVGTAGSQLWNQTANTTHHASVALWHFAQTFFEEFPAYKPNDERISLFTESYGGHYGPGIIDYFMRQNERIADGTISTPGAHYLHLSTLGIINGCIDFYDMMTSGISFPYNNTYGIQIYDEKKYKHLQNELTKHDGGHALIDRCRALQKNTDPLNHADVAKTNKACAKAAELVEEITEGSFAKARGGARFDITHEFQDPFPAPYMFGWLNNADVQRAFGVPVNHTWASPAVFEAFSASGDLAKSGPLESIARILDHGVNVALLHGDRDWACNWVGGESGSLRVPWKHQEEFSKAGYAPVALSYPYTQSGGLTRQYGNFSFTRVYQAGHMVPSYQPEAAYEIFMRAITHRDIATGTVDLRAEPEYATKGPSDTWWSRSDILPQPAHECYVLDLGDRCTDEEIEWIRDGSAIVKDWILIGRNASQAESHTASHVVGVPQTGGQQPLL
jgi:carboxypeptidase C (cathepsin A)